MAAEYLPDVFLLAMFRKLGANDRLSASQVCPNWFYRVREVNKAPGSLTILIGGRTIEDEGYVDKGDRWAFEYSPSSKAQIMLEAELEEENQAKKSYTKWNTLNFSINNNTSSGAQLNSTTAKQIIAAFPNITELNFIHEKGSQPNYEYLVEMFEASRKNPKNVLNKQLTVLRLIDLEKFPATSAKTSQRLLDLINHNLLSLKRLTIDIEGKFRFPMLYVKFNQFYDSMGKEFVNFYPKKETYVLLVLARLEKIRFKTGSNGIIPFLRSVNMFAADNAHLQIDLPNGLYELPSLRNPIKANANLLNYRIKNQIVNFTSSGYQIEVLDNRSIFSGLTSLSIVCSFVRTCAPMFKFISSHLRQLRHLKLCFSFRKPCFLIYEPNVPIFPTPTSPMPSVKVLELDMPITSCTSDLLEWLNLPVTMPNLKKIHFESYHCKSCNLEARHYDLDEESITSPTKKAAIRACFGKVVQQLCQITALPMEKITFQVDIDYKVLGSILLDQKEKKFLVSKPKKVSKEVAVVSEIPVEQPKVVEQQKIEDGNSESSNSTTVTAPTQEVKKGFLSFPFCSIL